MNDGDGRAVFRRRLARVAVLTVGLATLGAGGLSGALAQSDDAVVIGGEGNGESGVFADGFPFPSGLFDDEFLSDIFGGDFPGGSGAASGDASGGDINVGGSSGGNITLGGGGDISIGGGSSGSGGEVDE